MADNETHTPTTIERIISELNSEHGSLARAVGPLKVIKGLELASAFSDISRNEVTGKIAILSYSESPYGDGWDSRPTFDVTMEDLNSLAQTAPKFRPSFAEVAQKLADNLEDARQADRQAVNGWCDQGLPTAQATTVMKPLRWKPGQG